MLKPLQAFLLPKRIFIVNTPSQSKKNGVKLQQIKEIQISRDMTIYGQTLGVLKRENNE